MPPGRDIRKDIIYIPAFLMDMGTSSAILGITARASELGANSFIMGVMASANTILYVLFCQIFGRMSDRISRRRITQIASLFFSILYFFIPWCSSLKQLVIIFPFTGVFLSAYWPAYEAWIGELGGRRPLMKRVRMFNLFWTAGLMTGYATGGYIYDLHFLAPIYLSSATALITFIIISFQASSAIRGSSDNTSEQENKTEQTPTIEPHIAVKYLYLSRVANFVSWLTLGIMRFIFPKLIYELNMEPRVFGTLMLCQAGSQFITFFILGSTSRWHYRFLPLAITQLLACFSFIIIWRTGFPAIWAFALILFGLNTGMTYFSSIYYSLCGYKDLGGKTGWHESIIHSGVFFSTLIGGALANYVSLKTPYLFCAIMTIAGLPIQLFILQRRANNVSSSIERL